MRCRSNAATRGTIEELCRAAGIEPAIIALQRDTPAPARCTLSVQASAFDAEELFATLARSARILLISRRAVDPDRSLMLPIQEAARPLQRRAWGGV